MSWDYNRAKDRIRTEIQNTPTITVTGFSDYRILYETRRVISLAKNETVTPPLFNLPEGEAITADTAQIYIQITNYDDYRIENDEETEASHARALKFLHLYYAACDRTIQGSDAQRVDFHSGRMHAVVIDESGEGRYEDILLKAFKFVHDFRIVAQEAGQEFTDDDFVAHFRIGIDIGTCVAINSGNGHEQEPLFLGSPANHAAKLADGDKPGVYISDNVRGALALPPLGANQFNIRYDEDDLLRAVKRQELLLEQAGLLDGRSSQSIIENWRDEIIAKRAHDDPKAPQFQFHRKEPPLKDIDFADLAPSNSIRMELVSLFADLSGYTPYIDEAIAKNEIANAVTALHVIRSELKAVLEYDFGGKKVRFIGDCIHGLLAEGSSYETDDKGTVESSAKCAGALRSSFHICQNELENINQLGLAIGIEFGPTPITRAGIRGDRSVRIASSGATATSERVQRECKHNETAFGPNAVRLIPSSLFKLINNRNKVDALDHSAVVTSMSVTSQVTDAPYVYANPKPAGVSRAYFKWP